MIQLFFFVSFLTPASQVFLKDTLRSQQRHVSWVTPNDPVIISAQWYKTFQRIIQSIKPLSPALVTCFQILKGAGNIGYCFPIYMLYLLITTLNTRYIQIIKENINIIYKTWDTAIKISRDSTANCLPIMFNNCLSLI